MCQTMSMSEKSKNMRNRRVSQESLRCDSFQRMAGVLSSELSPPAAPRRMRKVQ
jgi:hypothetical protein